MARPESEHVKSLRAFRDRLIDARRAAAREPDLDLALRRFIDIETAIGLVGKAIDNEQDMTPLPPVDNPVEPPVFPPEPGTLPEAEIHARLCEALGLLPDLAPFREAARPGSANSWTTIAVR